jgi:hypothetical protein
MRRFWKRSASEDAPKHLEIWGELVENNLFLRRLTTSAAVFACLSLAMSSYALRVALYQPIAYHVDSDGNASYVGSLRGQSAPSDVEVRHIAKEFLKRYLAPNSLTIEADLADAFNLMTPELVREHQEQFTRYEKEHGEELVARIKKQAIQTELRFDPAKTEVASHNRHAFTVRMRGSTRTWPLNRVGEDAAFDERQFDATVTLIRCQRSDRTPNGLLVAKVSRKFMIEQPTGQVPAEKEK